MKQSPIKGVKLQVACLSSPVFLCKVELMFGRAAG